MIPAVVSLLLGVAAALGVWRLSTVRIRLPRRRLSDRRSVRIREATGEVNGSVEQVQSVARRQWVYSLLSVSGVSVAVAAQPRPMNVAAGAVVAAAAWQVPLVTARSRERQRRTELDAELTDSLGEMVMGVEAGLTLESVMNLYSRRHDTGLGREFRLVIDRVNLGSTRAAALDGFRDRTPTLEVQTFVSALQQNQKLGTPLSEVLRLQAASSRRRRRQAVEETAAKLSLKMVFPTVFCILPVLMIVVVGPAVIRLVHSLPG